ncbi:MAG: hypothetical protein KKI08_17785, partial [Armatimonadetes bacterium]|nr:hypothetical protein [Armatimonadota bacterium]
MHRRASLPACLMVGLAGLGLAAADLLIDTRFGVDTRPLDQFDSRGAERRVSGALPQGWADNSGWARVWATYTPRDENGEKFLRVSVSKAEQGRTCLCFNPLPNMAEETYYRLAVRLRSPSHMSATFALRLAPPPYTALWTETCYPSADRWDERTYTFRSIKNPAPIGFWIYLDGLGQTDLSALRLERLTREEAFGDLKARYPDAPTGNLMRNSRLPLGLQNGWNWRVAGAVYDEGDVQIGPDATAIGPSGAPALYVVLKKGIAFCSEPYAPTFAPDKYVASFYVRGTGQGQLHVLTYASPDKDYRVRGIAKFELTAPDIWQRVEAPFEPLPFVPTGSLRIHLDPGEYWLDALQVERGDKATPYAPQMTCEVAVALPPSPTATARVQFGDEPARLRWCATGAPQGATLKLQIINLYGETCPLPAVKLTGKSVQQGVAAYDSAVKQSPYGVIRLEAWVENASGRRLSPTNEIVVHRLRRPRHWGEDAPQSPFGVHINAMPDRLQLAKALGANWVRLHDPGSKSTDWYALEPNPGEWHFGDDDVFRYRAHKLMILGNLQTTPPWARPQGSDQDPVWGSKSAPPRDPREFANYVRTLVGRYRGVIRDWEFWNEPYWLKVWDQCDYPPGEGEGSGPAAQTNYVRLLRATYEAAKAANPTANVLGLCTNITPDRAGAPFSGTEWTEGFVAANGQKWCDGVSFHHYEGTAPLGFPGDNIDSGVGVVTAPFVAHDGHAPEELWMTEGSPLLFTPLPHVQFYHVTLAGDDWNVDLTAPGDRLARYVVELLAHRVKIFLYSMHCYSSSLFRLLGYNDIVGLDGYANVAAAAFSATAWQLEDL